MVEFQADRVFAGGHVAGDADQHRAQAGRQIVDAESGAKYDQVAVNPMGETVMATPAISDGTIFIRGRVTCLRFGARATPANS